MKADMCIPTPAADTAFSDKLLLHDYTEVVMSLLLLLLLLLSTLML